MRALERRLQHAAPIDAHRLGGELLRLARRHAGRQAARRADRGRRRRAERRRLEGLGARSPSPTRRSPTSASGAPRTAATGSCSPLGRPGPAPALGQHRHQEPGLLRRPVRRRADRPRHREHDAAGDAGRPSRTTATWRAPSTGTSRRRTASCASSASGHRHGARGGKLQTDGVDLVRARPSTLWSHTSTRSARRLIAGEGG